MKLLIFLLIAIVLIQTGFSIELSPQLFISKDSYTSGDEVSISLILINNLDSTKELTVDLSITNEDSTYSHLNRPISLTLKSGEERSVAIFKRTIDDSFQDGIYNVKTRVISENDVSLVQGVFSVKRTLKKMEVELNLCKDTKCKDKATVFSSNDKIYLFPASSEEEVSIISFLTYPTQKKEKISLPIDIMPGLEGSYQLDILATKEGFEEVRRSASFAVTSNTIKIEENKVCDPDNLCREMENRQNCPADCASGGEDNYCDKENDSICDPDCREDEDIDCIKRPIEIAGYAEKKADVTATSTSEKNQTRDLILPFIAIIIFASLLVYFMQRKK